MTQNTQANFQQFNPKNYLEEYYSEVGDENLALLKFFAEAYESFQNNSLDAIEIGGGPTIYQLISLAPKAKQMHFTDYLKENLDEISAWRNGNTSAFNWDNFIKAALKCEDGELNDQKVSERKNLLKQKLTDLSEYDVLSVNVIDSTHKFDLVSSNFVAESICMTKDDVSAVVNKFRKLLNPNGHLIMIGVLGADYWRAGEKRFPATSLTEDDVKQIVKDNGFDLNSFKVITAEHSKEDAEFQGYTGIFMLKAKLAG